MNPKTTRGETVETDGPSHHLQNPPMGFEEFRQRLEAEGLRPTDVALKQMFAALPLLEAMRARVRADYEMTDEPSSTFSARLGL